MSQLDKIIHDLGYEVEKSIATIETEKQAISELDKTITDLISKSKEINEYNKLKENDINKLESILAQNMARNNQMNGTGLLLDQRIKVLEEIYTDLDKKLDKLKETNAGKLDQYKSQKDLIKLKASTHVLKTFMDSCVECINESEINEENKLSDGEMDIDYSNTQISRNEETDYFVREN